MKSVEGMINLKQRTRTTRIVPEYLREREGGKKSIEKFNFVIIKNVKIKHA